MTGMAGIVTDHRPPRRAARQTVIVLGLFLSLRTANADWVYLPPAERIAASTLLFSGTANRVLTETAGEHRWHVAEVSVDKVLVGALPSEMVTVRTIDPASLQCSPNAGLLDASGRRFLWNFYRYSQPLEFASTDGPVVDLDDAKGVNALVSDIEAALASKPKRSADARQRLKAALAMLKQP